MHTKTKIKEELSNIYIACESNAFHQDIFNALRFQNEEDEDAVFIINRSEIRERYRLIKSLLPACQHHYAVKACPLDVVIEEIAALDGCFDVASQGEIKLLLKNEVSISKCIHTHPIKKKKEIQFALEAGITRFVVDNMDELEKFSKYKDQVELMLRLSFSNNDATIDLSSKFGIKPNEAFGFVAKASTLGYKICGLCFHVGSQMPSNIQYLKALEVCKNLYEEASEIGIHFSILDIGGGFPFFKSQSKGELQQFFEPINTYLETHFAHVQCIAEPGRFISAPIATLICQVIGKNYNKSSFTYYLNDGLYGCLSNKIFDFYNLSEMTAYSNCIRKEGDTFKTTLFGPTCDSIDKLCDDIEMPELEVGDTVVFDNIGAYSIASTTNFNMLGITKILILD